MIELAFLAYLVLWGGAWWLLTRPARRHHAAKRSHREPPMGQHVPGETDADAAEYIARTW